MKKREEIKKQLDILKQTYLIIERKYRWTNSIKSRVKYLNALEEIKQCAFTIKERI